MARKLLILLLLSFWVTSVGATDYSANANAVGVWLFTEGSGTTVDNAQGTATYDGVFKAVGEPAWSSTVPTYGEGGSPSYSVDYDASNDYILCGDLEPPATAMSVVAWSYSVLDLTDAIVSKHGSAGGNYGWIYGKEGNKHHLDRSPDGSAWAGVQSDNTYTGNNWHHLAFTWANDGTVTFYDDGAQNGTTESLSYSIHDSTTQFRIGSGPFTVDSGLLTEIAIFSDVLTSTEINEIMDYGLKPATAARRMWIF